MVVRKPEHAIGVFHEPNRKIGQKTYRGVDRLPWEDLKLAYYKGDLPTPLLPLWQELKLGSRDFTGLKLLTNYSDAVAVKNNWHEVSEIIALWSPELEQIKGGINCEIELIDIGLDCFCLGEWSVLLDGVYAQPEYFEWAVGRLNQHGLLSSDSDCSAIFDRYLELARTDIVEPLEDGAKATNIRVFACADTMQSGN
jgi:hypothetical protein